MAAIKQPLVGVQYAEAAEAGDVTCTSLAVRLLGRLQDAHVKLSDLEEQLTPVLSGPLPTAEATATQASNDSPLGGHIQNAISNVDTLIDRIGYLQRRLVA